MWLDSLVFFTFLYFLYYFNSSLPSELLSSGDPAVNTALISPRLKPYNIINVQEDFNYHATLYASDAHAYRTPTSGGAGIGSGLNTLSDFPFLDLDRVKWSDCNSNSGDCLTPKGFTFLRTRVADGAWIDVYNLHTDAGSDVGDVTARSKNFAQLAAYIATWSVGMPIIVMGDTNARYTRPGDSDTLHTFLSSTATSDLWISSIRAGAYPASGSDALVCPYPFPTGTPAGQVNACEVVDKMFLRTSDSLAFPSVTYANAHYAFTNSTGALLSDHYPLTSTISWALSSALRLGDPIGGPHGAHFNAVPALLSTNGGAVLRLTAITILGGSRIDGLSYTGVSGTTKHGGTGGSPSTLTLAAGERITSVYACTGKYSETTRVFYLKLTTNQGRTVASGATTSDCTTVSVPTDAGSPGAWGLVAFWGRAGNEIDRVGPIWGAVY